MPDEHQPPEGVTRRVISDENDELRITLRSADVHDLRTIVALAAREAVRTKLRRSGPDFVLRARDLESFCVEVSRRTEEMCRVHLE